MGPLRRARRGRASSSARSPSCSASPLRCCSRAASWPSRRRCARGRPLRLAPGGAARPVPPPPPRARRPAPPARASSSSPSPPAARRRPPTSLAADRRPARRGAGRAAAARRRLPAADVGRARRAVRGGPRARRTAARRRRPDLGVGAALGHALAEIGRPRRLHVRLALQGPRRLQRRARRVPRGPRRRAARLAPADGRHDLLDHRPPRSAGWWACAST